MAQQQARHPFSQYWKGPIAFLITAVTAFIVLLWSKSYMIATGALLVAVVSYAAYALGESSSLPGTSNKNDKNVPT